MRIRTITANRMDEALAIIRDQLGPEALILGTRKIKQANGEVGLEITAALHEPEPPTTTLPPLPANISSPPTPTGSLAAHGLPPELAARLSAAAGGLAGAGFTGADALEMVLPKLVNFTTLPQLLAPGRAHALVGPTGAGKTTLLIKLALAAQKQGRHVVILGLDDHKLGGHAPLEIAAELLGPGATLLTEASDLNTHTPPGALVLVDTPGLGLYHPGGAAALAQRLHNLPTPTSTHLVLPGNLNAADLALWPLAAGPLQPVSLLATKLDDTGPWGGLLAAAQAGQLQLAVAGASARLAQALVPLTPRYVADILATDPRLPSFSPVI